MLVPLVAAAIGVAAHSPAALAAGIQQVQEVGGTETAPSTNLTTTITTTTGDLIVVTATLRGVNTFASTAVGDSAGNTYTAVETEATGDSVTGMFYAGGARAVTAVTVEASGPATIAVSVQEFAGISPTSPLDVQVGAAGIGRALGTGTAPATAQAAELVVAGTGWDGSTASSGQTAQYTVNPAHGSTPAGLADQVQSAYLVTGAAGPQAYIAALGRPENWGAILATFTGGTPAVPTGGTPGAGSQPVAGSLDLQASSASAPATVTATASISGGSGSVAAYIWDWGDGSDTQGSAGPSDQHTFEYGGTYTVTLTALDLSGGGTAAWATLQLAGPSAPAAATGPEADLTGSGYCSAPSVSLSAWGEQEYVALNGGGSALHSPGVDDLVSIDGVYACGPLPELPTSLTSATAYGFQCTELAARYYAVEQHSGSIPSGDGGEIADSIASLGGLTLVPAPAEAAAGASPPVGVDGGDADWVTSSSNPADVLPQVGDVISMGASQASLDANPGDQAQLGLGHAAVVLYVRAPDVQTQADGAIVVAQQNSTSSPNPGLGVITVDWQTHGLSEGVYDEFNWVSMGYAGNAELPAPPAPAAAPSAPATGAAPSPASPVALPAAAKGVTARGAP